MKVELPDTCDVCERLLPEEDVGCARRVADVWIVFCRECDIAEDQECDNHACRRSELVALTAGALGGLLTGVRDVDQVALAASGAVQAARLARAEIDKAVGQPAEPKGGGA